VFGVTVSVKFVASGFSPLVTFSVVAVDGFVVGPTTDEAASVSISAPSSSVVVAVVALVWSVVSMTA
jgi:hypothetical protein